MHICYLGDVDSVHMRRWISHFSKEHRISLITLLRPGDVPDDKTESWFEERGCRLVVVPKGGPRDLLAPIRVRTALRGLKPDIVHAHYVTHYGFLASLSGMRPLVLSAYGSDLLIDSRNAMKRRMLSFALRRADLITSQGANVEDAMRSMFSFDAPVIRVVFGVDTEKFRPHGDNRGSQGGRMHTIINIRGFDRVYDPITFINAMALIMRDRPSTRAIMAGDGECFQRARAIIEGEGLANSISLHGWVDHEDIPALLADATVYVSTSTSDAGVPVGTMEAMASGVPVVTTNVGGISSTLRNGVDALIVPSVDAKAVAMAVIDIIDHPERGESMAINAREIVEREFSWQTHMATVERAYLELLH